MVWSWLFAVGWFLGALSIQNQKERPERPRASENSGNLAGRVRCGSVTPQPGPALTARRMHPPISLDMNFPGPRRYSTPVGKLVRVESHQRFRRKPLGKLFARELVRQMSRLARPHRCEVGCPAHFRRSPERSGKAGCEWKIRYSSDIGPISRTMRLAIARAGRPVNTFVSAASFPSLLSACR
jgi:hypothetical protein